MQGAGPGTLCSFPLSVVIEVHYWWKRLAAVEVIFQGSLRRWSCRFEASECVFRSASAKFSVLISCCCCNSTHRSPLVRWYLINCRSVNCIVSSWTHWLPVLSSQRHTLVICIWWCGGMAGYEPSVWKTDGQKHTGHKYANKNNKKKKREATVHIFVLLFIVWL